MRREVAAGALVAWLAAAFACSSFTSTDNPGDTGDGGSEAATDAGDAASPLPFCATLDATPAMCWSFDVDGDAALTGPQLFLSLDGGAAAITHDHATSPPNAALFSTPDNVGAVGVTWYPTTGTVVRCEADVTITDPSIKVTEFVTMLTSNNAAQLLVQQEANGGLAVVLFVESVLVDGGGAAEGGVLANASVGTPFHVLLTYRDATWRAEVADASHAEVPASASETVASVGFGLIATARVGVVFDNLVCFDK